jgi:hypothetical protein
MMPRALACIPLCLLVLATLGCTTYYVVRDPASGRAYYTTKVESAGQTGAVKFKDGRTGSQVTMQSSEVKEISSAEYEAGVKQK